MLDNSVVPDNTIVKKTLGTGRKPTATNSGKVWIRLMSKHGRYNIVRRVADGGMAEIFLATQVGRDGFQKPVILKRIHSTIYADPQFRNMFIDEAHISMSLAHSNIAQVLDLGVAAGRYFLVLELVDGWDLGRVLQRAATAGTPLPRELGLHITADVCRALAYAHGKTDGQRALGIVHRDVSPHNVLLSEQGEVKLTDFGIAKAMNKREQTGTGVVKGKVAFMSPEQAMGKPIDARSDIFSLGTMLYLLMVRSRPFEGPTDLETLLRVQKGDFAPPEAVAPDLEPEVAAIINRSMKLDPAERYQTADDMLTDLERVLRTVFQPVGQTELKRWLHELSAHDGHPSIGKAPERVPSAARGPASSRARTSCCPIRRSMDDEEVIDGEAVTSLAVVEGGGGAGRMRLSRHRAVNAAPSLPVPRDAETDQEGRPSQEMALPIPDTEEPPGRRAQAQRRRPVQGPVVRPDPGGRRLVRRPLLPPVVRRRRGSDRDRRGRGRERAASEDQAGQPSRRARSRPRPSRRPESPTLPQPADADAGAAAGSAAAEQPPSPPRRSARRRPASRATDARARKAQRSAAQGARPRFQEHDGARPVAAAGGAVAPRAAVRARAAAPRPKSPDSAVSGPRSSLSRESGAPLGLSASRTRRRDGGPFCFLPEPCRLGQLVGTTRPKEKAQCNGCHGCRCFAAFRGCSPSQGAPRWNRAGSKAARPPRRTWRWMSRPAGPLPAR